MSDHQAENDARCHECGHILGPHDAPPFGPPRHFVCPPEATTGGDQ